MSVEQLLFFLLLVAIPLLERLIRAMRARTGGSPAEGTPAAVEVTVSRPPPAVSVPDAGATGSERQGTELALPDPSLPHSLPEPVRRAAPEQLPAFERQPRMRSQRKQAPATSVRGRHADPPTAVRRVLAGGRLRRAIVLIAILGPCRALEAKDPSQPG